MITYRGMGVYVDAQPFHPFRITTADGRTFDVRHPEMVKVGRTTMTIFTALADDADDTPNVPQFVEVSLLLTVSVEPLPAVAARGTL